MTDGAVRWTVDELIEVPALSDARVSPEAELVAFVVRMTDWEANAYGRRVWLVDTAGGEAHAVAANLDVSVHPRWTGDGRLYVLGRRGDGPTCIFRVDPRDGSAARVADLPSGAGGFAVSPVDERIACVVPSPSEERDPSTWEEQFGKARVIEEPSESAEVWILEPGASEFRKLTDSNLRIQAAVWRPDGKGLAVVAARDPSPAVWDRNEIFLCDVQSGRLRETPCGTGCASPMWSPDGDRLAFTRLGEPSYAAVVDLGFYDLRTGSVSLRKPLADDVCPIAWNAEGLHFLGVRGTAGHLFRLDLATDAVVQITPDLAGGFALVEGWGNEGCQFSRDGTWMSAVCHTAHDPGEVMLVNVENGDLEVLTGLRSHLAARLPTSEVVAWEIDDGTRIEGVLHCRAEGASAEPVPLVVVPHGGPTVMALQAPLVDSDWWLSSIPLLTDRGAIVLRPNYRGSAGYGDAFRRANIGKLARANLEDILAGVDALAAEGRIDASRVGITGMSHGGYLAAYLSMATGRFRAAITQSGTADWRFSYYTNLTPDWPRQYFLGPPWDETDRYAELSPLHFVKRAHTPMLILHGESDRLAPTENAHALHRALRERGVPVRLVLYGDTGHGPSRPRELRHHMKEVVEWMEAWVLSADPRDHADASPAR